MFGWFKKHVFTSTFSISYSPHPLVLIVNHCTYYFEIEGELRSTSSEASPYSLRCYTTYKNTSVLKKCSVFPQKLIKSKIGCGFCGDLWIYYLFY